MLVVVWALMAAINLAGGVVIASWPERQSDLNTMRRWGGTWLTAGVNIYGVEGEAVDYPPNAIAMLSLLVSVAPNWLVPIWATLNLVLAPVSVYLAVRAVRPRDPLAAIVPPMLMFLCWGGFRTLLQFTLLTLTLGFAAQVLAKRHPTWSGICLGLALMKPQVAAPFVLWTLFTRRLRVLTIAVLIVAAGFACYCFRTWANPVDVVSQYVKILTFTYANDASGLVGLSQMRPLIELAVSNQATVNAVAGAIALTMLAGICTLGYFEGRQHRRLLYSAPALAGIWSLLTFYHLTYGFLLVLPTATLLLWAEDPGGATIVRRRIFWLLQAGLMFDLPGLWRWFGPSLPVPASAGLLLTHADQLLMIGLFASMTALSLGSLRPRDDEERRPQ